MDCPRRNFVKLLQRRRADPDGNENLSFVSFSFFLFFLFIGGLETPVVVEISQILRFLLSEN